MVSKRTSKYLLEWEPLSPRLLRERFNINVAKLSVVSCDAPTEEADDINKDHFYEDLQTIIEKIPSDDMLLVIGDFYARKDSIRQYQQAANHEEKGTLTILYN